MVEKLESVKLSQAPKKLEVRVKEAVIVAEAIASLGELGQRKRSLYPDGGLRHY